MAYSRKSRPAGGGGSGPLAVVGIVLVLAGLGALAYWRITHLEQQPAAPSGPQYTVKGWKDKYNLSGTIPEILPGDWPFVLDMNPYYQPAAGGERMPSAWITIQLESGRFTALYMAQFRDSLAPLPMGLLADFAGETEGAALQVFITELAGMSEGSCLERETGKYRLFAWRYLDDGVPRRSMVCVTMKGGFPQADALYAKEKADWAVMPRKQTAPPRKIAPPKKPAPAAEPTAEPAAEPPKEPAKEPVKEPVKEPAKEPAKKPAKESAKEEVGDSVKAAL